MNRRGFFGALVSNIATATGVRSTIGSHLPTADESLWDWLHSNPCHAVPNPNGSITIRVLPHGTSTPHETAARTAPTDSDEVKG